MNMRQILGLHQTDGDVGVEIELETTSRSPLPPDITGDQWRLTRDGSLRGNSGEYVLRAPAPIERVSGYIARLRTTLKNSGIPVTYSFRAGVHVHVNVQELSLKELVQFAALYYILENVLVEWCGPDRVGNHFCLRSCDAERSVDLSSQVIRERNWYLLEGATIRYASLNWHSLIQYGSLEFRAMSTKEGLEDVEVWAHMLYNLREKAKEYNSPQEIFLNLSDRGSEDFVLELVGEENFKLLRGCEDFDYKIHEGMRLAQDFVFWCGQLET